MREKTEGLEDILEEISESGGDEFVTAGAVLDRFQHRSLGVLLALLGLITVLPIIGDIPGAAILCATLALAAIVQSLRGTGRLWAPDSLRRREISRERLERAIEAARPWVRRIDRLLKPRLRILSAGRTQHLIIAGAAAALAFSLYPLAFVPFGANAPGAGLIALGLGLMTGDGLLVLLGYAMSGLTVYVLVTALSAGPW